MGMDKGIIEKVRAKLPEIKKLLFADEQPAPKPEEVKAATATLVDGTTLNVNPAIEVGATATVVDGEGQEIAAPDGEHELQDGTIIKIEGGVITEVKPVEAAKEQEQAPTLTEAQAQEIAASAVKPLADRIKAIEAVNKQLFSIIETMAGLPAEAETEQKKDAFKKKDPSDIATRLAAARAKLHATN